MDEEFEPRLGKSRARNPRLNKRFAHQVVAAINRAGGRARTSGKIGRFYGRGSAIGAVLANRDQYAAYRQRRVVVKARIVRLAGKGISGAVAHLRYLQREGVNREGERGVLYGAEADRMDGKAFLNRADGDRHQFRFIVAPEDGIEYDDLKSLTRRLMTQMEEDLGTKLDWVAVDHFNTGHPHTHIMLRGKDDEGHDLIIARNYLSMGMRERAAELVRLDLGPRTDLEIEDQLRAEMTKEGLTSLDKQLLRMEGSSGGMVSPLDQTSPARQTLLAGRLKHLERLGLAVERHPNQWQLDAGLEGTLRRMGERGDIIKTMHREMTEQNLPRSPSDYVIHHANDGNSAPVTGRVIARGLSDELNDRHYLIVDATDGRSHYIDIGRGEATEPTSAGSIVSVTRHSTEPRQADLTIVDVAAANGGRYNVDLHLKHDPRATADFAETHIRRLEAIRRTVGNIAREPDGTWNIAADHLDKTSSYEQARAKQVPVLVNKLSNLSLDQQIGTDGATWLDREMASGSLETTRNSGFGHDLRDAVRKRLQWLVEQGLVQEEQGRVTIRPDLIATLQKRELTRIAGQLSDQLGLAYTDTSPGERVEGTLRRTINLSSGKYALIERSRDFTLVPWRDVLDKHIGKQVSGIMRDGGGISWTIGRQRGIGIS